MNNLIKLLNLNKTFDSSKKIKVLKKISFNFKKGKIYSLMGPSGSGKSTLLNLLSLIDKPSSGSILIEDKVINFNDKNRNDILRAKNIGIIYQQDNLLPDFTAMENIYLASLAAGNNKDTSISK
jgi:ABC-type lipoprotein export system ATPase subunit